MDKPCLDWPSSCSQDTFSFHKSKPSCHLATIMKSLRGAAKRVSSYATADQHIERFRFLHEINPNHYNDMSVAMSLVGATPQEPKVCLTTTLLQNDS
jgi:hypothetical protein